MRILFVTRPHVPLIGGAELTTHALASALSARDHTVEVLAERRAGAPAALGPRVFPYRFAESADVIRELPAALAAAAPDVVVVEGRLRRHGWSRRLLRAAAGHPTVMHVQNAGPEHLAVEPELRVDGVVAVSRFLADRLRRHGVDAVVAPPAIEPGRVGAPRERRVALLCDAAPFKGVDTVLALARARPDIPFALTLGRYARTRELADRAASLPNVELRPATPDPAQLYRDARVVLVPSVHPEGFGRVAAEAGMCGIPVIATRAGGLPEAGGGGAAWVEPGAPAGDWVLALGAFWDDPDEYARRALPDERPELHPDAVAETWEGRLAWLAPRRAAA